MVGWRRCLAVVLGLASLGAKVDASLTLNPTGGVGGAVVVYEGLADFVNPERSCGEA